VRAGRFWLLLSDKLGDNAQARVLAAASGLPFTEKRILMRPEYVFGKPRFCPSLHHVDPARSDPLEPPWPDLVLTIGRRCAMAALWVREQSGGRTRLALIGRPRPGPFDLVVVPPQYRAVERPGVVRLDLPLMRADPARLEEARTRFSHLAELPRPLTAVLVGGATRPFRFDAAEARRLADELLAMQAREGGSLYVTTSRRTGAVAANALERALVGRAHVYRFCSDAPDNPYFGLLAYADRFVVTGDSVSMMVEVARLGRPLAIRPLPFRRDPSALLDRLLARLRDPERLPGRILSRAVPSAAPRDLAAFWDYLRARGLAVMFGEPFRPPAPVCDADLARAAAALRRLADIATGAA